MSACKKNVYCLIISCLGNEKNLKISILIQLSVSDMFDAYKDLPWISWKRRHLKNLKKLANLRNNKNSM